MQHEATLKRPRDGGSELAHKTEMLQKWAESHVTSGITVRANACMFVGQD
jgi:hypothetical protein